MGQCWRRWHCSDMGNGRLKNHDLDATIQNTLPLDWMMNTYTALLSMHTRDSTCIECEGYYMSGQLDSSTPHSNTQLGSCTLHSLLP